MELVIEVIKPEIQQNFDEVKTDLIESTAKYEIEVTADNLTTAKKAGADINKIRSDLKSRAKEYIDVMEAPIIEFKAKLKELDTVLEGRRSMIMSQVSVFEDLKRADHVKRMGEYLTWLIDENRLEEQRARALDVKPFASVAGLTSKGNLNAKSKGQVEAIVRAALDEQKTALVEAENKRLKDEARAEEIIRERVEKAKKEDIAAGIAEAVQKPVEEKQETPAQYNEVAPQAEERVVKVVTDREVERKAELPPRDKSIYRITMTYEISSQPGADVALIEQKVVPMITAGKVPVSKVLVEEVTYDFR